MFECKYLNLYPFLRFVEFIQKEHNAKKIIKETERVMDAWYKDGETGKTNKRHAGVRQLVLDCLNLNWQNRMSAGDIIESQT